MRLAVQRKQTGLQLTPHKTKRFLPLSLKEFSAPGARKPQGTHCPSGLTQTWTPGGLKRASEAEQPFELQFGLDHFRDGPGYHENLLLRYKGTVSLGLI